MFEETEWWRTQGNLPSPRGLKASAHKFIYFLTQHNLAQSKLRNRHKKLIITREETQMRTLLSGVGEFWSNNRSLSGRQVSQKNILI